MKKWQLSLVDGLMETIILGVGLLLGMGILGMGPPACRAEAPVKATFQQTIPTLGKEGMMDDILYACFSPDSKIIASGLRGDCSLWEADTGKLIRKLPIPCNYIMFIGDAPAAFSPDGKMLVTGGWDGVQLWDIVTGKKTGRLGKDRFAQFLVFSPDGKTLATTEDSAVQVGDTVGLWNVAGNVPLFSLKQPGIIRSIRFSPDGNLLACVASQGNQPLGAVQRPQCIQVWNTKTGTLQQEIIPEHNPYPVWFSSDGNTLYSGDRGEHGGIQVWDIGTGKLLRTLEIDLQAAVSFLDVNPEGTVLVGGEANQVVKLWDTATGALIQKQSVQMSDLQSACFSPDGKRLAVVGWGKVHGVDGIALWTLSRGK